MMNKKLLPFFSVLILIVVSCTDKRESITPELNNINESVYASGVIKSISQYEVFGRANGIIENILVTEGMQVKKGDTIFQLNNNNLKIATENARLASATSDFKLNTNKLKDANKAINLAAQNLSNDSLLFERQKVLWSKTIGSKVELEQRELAYENSKTAFAKAKTNYDDLRRQLKLASDQSKNNLEIARLMEDDFIVRSEVDGVVYRINKEKGELINGSGPAAIIGTDHFVIELHIDELDIVKIKKGQKVIIRMDSYQSQVFEAEMIAIDPMMNLRTRSFEAEAIFMKNPEELFPNLTVEASIIINSKENVLTIPRAYLVNDSCVLQKGGERIKVDIGLMDYDLVEIKGGIDKTTMIELPEE